MAQRKLGVHVTGPDSGAILAGIQKAEEAGIQAAWLTTGGAGPDGLTILAGAAVSTQRILLGTSIIPTFPRHPLVMAQQVQVIQHLALGRFRLGIGPSGRSGMEETFGVDYRAPLGHVSEYLHILKSFLQQGEVDFDGRYYQAHAKISTSPMDVPVMASALGVKAYELCGAGADGAISWVCPGKYLRDVGLPAMKRSAENAGRPVPPLVAHVPVCVHEDPDEARESVRQQFGFFPQDTLLPTHVHCGGVPRSVTGDLERRNGGCRSPLGRRRQGGGKAGRVVLIWGCRDTGLACTRRTGQGGFIRPHDAATGEGCRRSVRLKQI